MADVSLVRCDNYNYDDVYTAVKMSFENLGGISKFIDKGDRVLLKVNLLTKKKPEEAVTTHPAFIKAIAMQLIEYGATVTIGDSPGGPFTRRAMEAVYNVCGITEAVKGTSAQLNYNFNSSEKSNPEGLILKKLTVTDMLNDVDKVISVSKLKTHSMMTFTGAVKNMFGIIPGITKAEYHLNLPHVNDFANALIDICLLAAPVLSFMDGIVAMEGAGPSAGEPRKLDVVIASSSPFSLDKAAASIIGLACEKIPTIKRSVERGICGEGLLDIKLVGDDIEGFKVNDFALPLIANVSFVNRLPKFMRGLMLKALKSKPVFDKSKCIKCGICRDNCPAKVISIDGEKPAVDMDNCIRCYCCQELCPEKAVFVHRPIIMRLVDLVVR